MPTLTTQQMIEVDRAMIEDYRIDLIQMMENAGRNLAHLARVRFLDGDPRGKSVVVLAGAGGNGGGALVGARRLANWGARVLVGLGADPARFGEVPAHQLEIARRMGIPVASVGEMGAVEREQPSLIIDGLIGYSLHGDPRADVRTLIEWANSASASTATSVPMLSLDIPSGIDGTSGTVHQPAIRATATMTLALPKQGLRVPAAAELVGELWLADISVPPGLYARPGLELADVGALFARDEVIRIG